MALIEQIAVLCSTGLFVLIWMVQLLIYPSFLTMEGGHFKTWHARYTTRMTFIVLPLMFGQALSLAYLGYSRGSPSDWIHLTLCFLCWLATFLLAVPLHRQLTRDGYDATRIRRLTLVNWPRTFCWSALAILQWLR